MSIGLVFRLNKPWRRREVKQFITIGNEANQRRLWAEADAAYAAALALDPTLTAIWVQYGHALKEQGFLQRAEQAYRRSLALDDTMADTHLQLGHVLKLQGQVPAAQTAYMEAYRRDPKSPNSRAELASLGVQADDGPLDPAGHPITGLQGAPDREFAPDAAFLEAVYGTKRVPEGNKTAYLSIDHLLHTYNMEDEFQEIFDQEFYYFAHQETQFDIKNPNFAKCLVHFCEIGVDLLYSFDEDHGFDADFYRTTYLNRMPFTAVNAYRHWLSQGLRQKWAPNRKIWIRDLFGRDIQNLDKLDIALCTAIVAPDVRAEGWNAQFKRFIDTDASDPRAPLLIDDSTVSDFVAIADRQAVHGMEPQAFALYQRILQHVPGHTHTLRHYADGLLRRDCLLEAKRIYQHLVDHDPDPNIWAFISLSQCNERLGLPIEALTALRRGVDAFPGDVSLRDRLSSAASGFLSRIWDTATATARLGRFDQAQADLAAACTTVSALVRAPQRLHARAIRSIALVGNKDLPQCRFYRIDQKVEQLEQAGYTVVLYDFHQGIPLFLSEIYQFEAVIFYRVPALYPVIEAIEKAKELGLTTFYEIDDLIFDAQAYPDSFESYDGQIEQDEYIGLKLGVPLFAHALSLCDFALASTTPLAEQMRPRAAAGPGAGPSQRVRPGARGLCLA